MPLSCLWLVETLLIQHQSWKGDIISPVRSPGVERAKRDRADHCTIYEMHV
jgi:hypothetical protein